jgi:hypothetical protein
MKPCQEDWGIVLLYASHSYKVLHMLSTGNFNTRLELAYFVSSFVYVFWKLTYMTNFIALLDHLLYQKLVNQTLLFMASYKSAVISPNSLRDFLR